MLFVTDKKADMVGQLAEGEYDFLVAAFTQDRATAQEREQGAAVVRKYQQLHRWFGCSCLGTGGPAPILFPVTESHVRRDSARPDHADGCPFEMDKYDRQKQVIGLRGRVPANGFTLAPAIAQPDAAVIDSGARNYASLSKAYYRTRLSQMLFEFLFGAKVHQIGAGTRIYEAQLQALHQSARHISLGGGLWLSEVLETDPAKVTVLADRIGARRTWPKGRRPHGVLVFVAERIEGDAIMTATGQRIAVQGPISVFGPGRGARRQGPFIVAVLIASPDGRQPLVPLEAYAHPCWSARDVLPLDSSHERRCLDILVAFQRWMAAQSCRVELTKPLYDRSEYFLGAEAGDRVIKPDFEGIIRTAKGDFLRSFAVEVMGYDDAEYRATKAQVREAITGKRTFYLEHLAHDPAHQDEHDYDFRRVLKKLGDLATVKANALPAHHAAPIPSRAAQVLTTTLSDGSSELGGHSPFASRHMSRPASSQAPAEPQAAKLFPATLEKDQGQQPGPTWSPVRWLRRWGLWR